MNAHKVLSTAIAAAALCASPATQAPAFWTDGGREGGALEQLGISAEAAVLPDIAPAAPSSGGGGRKHLTLMFYLDNQSDDLVDGYVMSHYRELLAVAREHQEARFLFILDKSKLDTSRPANSNELVMETVEAGSPVEIERISGRNFADAEALKRFLAAGFRYGSDLNVLVMSDHGDADFGLMTTSFPDPASLTGKISEMRLVDAAAALKAAADEAGRELDLLVLDACLMANIEALSELARPGVVAYAVASENATIPSLGSGGVPLAGIIGGLLAGGGVLGPRELGLAFVEGTRNNPAADLGLYDLEALRKSSLPEDLRAFSELLLGKPAALRKSFASLNGRKRSANIGYFFTDLKTLVAAFSKAGPRELAAAGDRIVADIEAFQLAFETDKKDVYETGLTIRTGFLVPANAAAAGKLRANYRSLFLPASSGWESVIDELDRSF